MKIFHCAHCGSVIFFENVQCLACGNLLGFVPERSELGTFEPAEADRWVAVAKGSADQKYRRCQNAGQHQVCNWMVPAEEQSPFCVSCRMNDVIPNLSIPGNLERWRKLEVAKRRAIYTLLRLGLPTDAQPDENRPPLRFRFLSDIEGQPKQLSGHLNGLITINTAEADDAERESRRVALKEPYRALLGHMRHELAHYYWDRLVSGSRWQDEFRGLFGDERGDYSAALALYHQQGAPADWQNRHISAYASAHPWEDWAETGAHYFHIIDMLEIGASFGLTLNPSSPADRALSADLRESQNTQDLDALLKMWMPLSQALNSLNRGMGLQDAYPFVLSTPVMEKLQFIHEIIRSAAPASMPPDNEARATEQPRDSKIRQDGAAPPP